ncbi:hypothetical protein [Microvirga aerophila]|uniref:Uncharacterized protein n=1 Tax=Microvirga aerophila TaxID=670291 RepID=A0A512C4X7_9HYPH|nr:hypothetical protein [Microvirga aerophila]GEO19286.1 hypothetical protein MAE02_69820 [Microvirga aerophila]
MRQVLFGLVGALAAGAAGAETYSFTAVTADMYREQTVIHCTRPKTNGLERVPKGCILSDAATAYPNHSDKQHSIGVTCASGHPIEFHANGTLAECVLDIQQHQTVEWPGVAACKGRLVRFNRDGRADC